MKTLMMAVAVVFAWSAFADTQLSVTGVTARQRDVCNGLVDITVTMRGSAEDASGVECVFTALNSATQAAFPVKHITRDGEDAASGDVLTRKFVWDAKADVGAVKIDDIALTVGAKPLGGVQLWKDGPYWAEYNVGAMKPDEYGYYFWWGDTVGYKRNTDKYGNKSWISAETGATFSFCDDNCPTYNKSDSTLRSEGYVDATTNLVAKYDAAAAHLGAPWRMPTDEEFSALIRNCTTMWTNNWNGTGVNGRLVTGKGAYASKSIFLPAAGYGYYTNFTDPNVEAWYWSSSLDSDQRASLRRKCACYLLFDSSRILLDSHSRSYGQPVRPVRGAANAVSVADSVVTVHFALEASAAAPTVEGDEGATVTGDAETGFVVRPSEGNMMVEVSIPEGVDAERVTVEVTVKVERVKPHGATVKVVRGSADITEFLDISAADESGVIDLAKAMVKEEFVKEALDPEKGAVIDLCGGPMGTAGPVITTAPTRPGLVYAFREGTTLDGFFEKNPSATKIGDGEAWTPTINVKGGETGFYSIGVSKGE